MAVKKSSPNVRVTGSGDQVVVFLHGFMSSKDYWRRVLRRLDLSEITAVSVDLLGFGKAPKPPKHTYSYEDHIEYIHSVINDLELSDEQIVLVGHSMGALIAARYSIVYPNVVKGLGLINPPFYTDVAQAESTITNAGLHYRFLLNSQYRELVWAIGRYLRLFSSHSKDSREGSLYSVITRAKFIDDVSRITVPSIITIGMKDRWLVPSNVSLVETNHLIKVHANNKGHHPAIIQPALVAKDIKGLLSLLGRN